MLPRSFSGRITLPLSAGTTLALVLSACTATSPSTGEQATVSAAVSAVPGGDLDKMAVVTCLLPGQIRRLGGQFTYLTARRPIKTTISDCEIRGGEYVAFDRSDYATALKTLLHEAQAGKPIAQTYVGEIYERGLGLAAPDYAQAAQWYRKAAEQGYAPAQTNLGTLYEKGLGVPKDPTEALNWYRKASGLTDDQLTFESSLEAERQAFRQEISLREKAITALNTRLQSTQRQLQARNQSLQAAQQQIKNVRSQLQRLQSAPPTAANSTEAQALQRRLQELEAQNEKIKQQNANTQQELQARNQSLQAAQQQIKAVRDQLQRLQSAPPTAANSTEVQALQRQLQERESQYEQQSQQLVGAQKQFEKVQAALIAQKRDLDSEVENSRKAAHAAQQQIDELQKQMARTRDRTEIESLQQKVIQLQKLESTRKEQGDQIHQVIAANP